MDKITVFFSKSTGNITSLCTGIQDMRMFGSNAADMTLIWDYTIVDYNQDLLSNYKYYKVDTETKTVYKEG